MYRKRLTLSVVALVAAATLLAGCGDDSDDGAAATGSSAAEDGATQADVQFARQMIPHHAQAVEMAQMLPADGVSSDLVELATAIEDAQQPEIDQLTAMLDRWGFVPPPTEGGHGHDMAGMMTEEDMTELGAATGAEFERMWLTMMIEHHRGAIEMAEDLLDEGEDEEARALAQEIVDAQQAEITQMEQMLAD